MASDNATSGTDRNLRAAQAQSGLWHLLGPRGCLSVSADRIRSENVDRITADQRSREWCSYCGRELRIIEREREIERLESIRDAVDATVFVAPARTRKDRKWHADADCSSAPDDPVDWSLQQARDAGLDPCKLCVLGVDRPDTQDHSHYQSLVEADVAGLDDERGIAADE